MKSPQSPQITENQAANLVAVLTEALRASEFGPFRFIRSNERFNHAQVQQLHAETLKGFVDLRPNQFYSLEVHTNSSEFENLMSSLEISLASYMDEERRQIGFMQTTLPFEKFVTATIRAAAIASPEAAVAAIQQWVSGAPWVTTHTFTLTGIKVQSPLEIGSRVSLKQLPEQLNQLRLNAPSFLVDELQRPGLYSSISDLRNATVLCWEEDQRPVFWPANRPPDRVEESAFPNGVGGVFSLLRALSLVCNVYVKDQLQWNNSSPMLRAFDTRSGEGVGGSSRSDSLLVAPQVTLTPTLLEQAMCVSTKLQNAPGPVSEAVNRTFRRWAKSVRGRQPSDQLIDMRIALESLFAGEGRNEATLRVAYHGARYLGESFEERKRLFDDIKKIYSTASTLIHGGRPNRSQDISQLVECAHVICRDAMLKMLDESEIPNWTDLMLKDN